MYYKHLKYGSLPKTHLKRGEQLYNTFMSSLSTSTSRSPKPLGGDENLTTMGEALASIAEYCEIDWEEFFEVTRGTTKKDSHPANTLLRAAIMTRLRRDKVDVNKFIELYLNTEDDIAAGAHLNDHHSNKKKDTVSTGSHRLPGLSGGKWALPVKTWVSDGQQVSLPLSAALQSLLDADDVNNARSPFEMPTPTSPRTRSKLWSTGPSPTSRTAPHERSSTRKSRSLRLPQAILLREGSCRPFTAPTTPSPATPTVGPSSLRRKRPFFGTSARRTTRSRCRAPCALLAQRSACRTSRSCGVFKVEQC